MYLVGTKSSSLLSTLLFTMWSLELLGSTLVPELLGWYSQRYDRSQSITLVK